MQNPPGSESAAVGAAPEEPTASAGPDSDWAAQLRLHADVLLQRVTSPLSDPANLRDRTRAAMSFQVSAFAVGSALTWKDKLRPLLNMIDSLDTMEPAGQVSYLCMLAGLANGMEEKEADRAAEAIFPRLKYMRSSPDFYGNYIKIGFAAAQLLEALVPRLSSELFYPPPASGRPNLSTRLIQTLTELRDNLEARFWTCRVLIAAVRDPRSPPVSTDHIDPLLSMLTHPYAGDVPFEFLSDVASVIQSAGEQTVANISARLFEIIKDEEQSRRIVENVYAVGKAYCGVLLVLLGRPMETMDDSDLTVTHALLDGMEIELWDGNAEAEAGRLIGALADGFKSAATAKRACDLLCARMKDTRNSAEESDFTEVAMGLARQACRLDRDGEEAPAWLDRLLEFSLDTESAEEDEEGEQQHPQTAQVDSEGDGQPGGPAAGEEEREEEGDPSEDLRDDSKENAPEGEEWMESQGNTLAVRCAALRALGNVLETLSPSEGGSARAQVHQRLFSLSQHPNTYIRLCSTAALVRGGAETLTQEEWEAVRDAALPFVGDPQWMYAEIAAEIVTRLSIRDPSLVGPALAACGSHVGLTVLLHTCQGFDISLRHSVPDVLPLLLESTTEQLRRLTEGEDSSWKPGVDALLRLLTLRILSRLVKGTKYPPLNSYLRLDGAW
uniref:Uncharacterized protein n=1 Tax=Chromera velia CCMP2878 TaxID=1169474 RepID=A0A0G4I9P5_9ALVE|eukprot:Cvel_2057.t1-p1 / transcript=Cvel_2057.t1 / gene=Cvel_2057 / organism=Chromera_velia_CCMP2878 / gene_product=hypothetical protein / transcript_product=hypothetical protein / location=Cvel_scaffold79:56506-58509(-) / protein_length=668 / sequence_SO=supercontig / SO=protein_coding / is_pseudo=false